MRVKAYTIELQGEPVMVFKAICCREWEIFVGQDWGQCGYCDTKPIPVG